MPHPQIHHNLVQLLHPQVPLVLCVGTQPVFGYTHGVHALADQSLAVVLSLGPNCDQLKCVGSGAELSVSRLHPLTCAVGQVDAANGILFLLVVGIGPVGDAVP